MLESLLIIVLGVVLVMFIASGLGALVGIVVGVVVGLVRSLSIIAVGILKVCLAIIAFPFRLVGIGR